jgi:SAM-dependent methyltransferase
MAHFDTMHAHASLSPSPRHPTPLLTEPFFRTLARQAAACYPSRDRFARHFAFGKLTRDPVFRHVLASGLIAPGARVVDLGCGQGLLAALLQSACRRAAAGEWPAHWPQPAHPSNIRGIEFVRRDVDRARLATPEAQWVCGDMRTTEFGQADVVVMLDVLHYVEYEAQAEILQRVRESLGDGGVLILRVADASDTLRARITMAIDRLVMRLRGHPLPRLYGKPLERWTRELAAMGFQLEAGPMSAGTPFANVLLVGRLPA